MKGRLFQGPSHFPPEKKSFQRKNDEGGGKMTEDSVLNEFLKFNTRDLTEGSKEMEMDAGDWD